MTTTHAHDAYQKALLTEQPTLELRAVAAELLDRGISRDSLIEQFEQLRGELRAAHREADEDVVLEVMDYVVGFSSPHMRL